MDEFSSLECPLPFCSPPEHYLRSGYPWRLPSCSIVSTTHLSFLIVFGAPADSFLSFTGLGPGTPVVSFLATNLFPSLEKDTAFCSIGFPQSALHSSGPSKDVKVPPQLLGWLCVFFFFGAFEADGLCLLGGWVLGVWLWVFFF